MKNQRLILVLAFLFLIFNLNAQLKTKIRWSADSSSCIYNGWALNSNLNSPIVRFNIESFRAYREKLGSIEYFGSAGAGIGISYGKIKIKTNSTTSIRNNPSDENEIQMRNLIGFNAGFIFSKSGDELTKRTIFAPVICFQLLDFQIGYGYELGDVANTAHRSFITISYGISINKLTDAGSFLISRPEFITQSGQIEKLNIRELF